MNKRSVWVNLLSKNSLQQGVFYSGTVVVSDPLEQVLVLRQITYPSVR
jgi:hypothetical protein